MGGFGATPGVTLKRPVSLDDLTTDTEYDPEGAEEFAAVIRALRKGAPLVAA